MRCNKHLSDHSSSVGVCASCLRERLLASQSQSQSEDRPPLIFPRSVSPYVSRRKTDEHRFYSTPQVGPIKKFSLISNLFRSRSGNPRVGCPDSTRRKQKSTLISNRGMSPAREAESDEDCDPLPWGNAGRTRTTSFGGLAFCLSPLVRASPKRGLTPELSYSGEVKPQLSTAASSCANRSRKLADFGRVNHNR